ncbi:MAG: hypothetical protein A2Z05_02120 [Chloroflexi bacterium RBG_16_60_22]|nr:MAG: hypothetical protein A2Z05_02120 [Chloroflexi bacterium RBG_16_60_22]
MKVVLLNPRLRTWSPNVYVPLGLTYIAAVLQKEGHHVRIIDLNVEKIGDDSLKGILADAGIAGITGMITEYAEVIRVADLVKGAKDGLTVVLGGPLASTFPRELLEASRADLAVIGEGERTAVTLVAAIEKGGDLHNINGLAFKKDGKIEFTGPVEPITDLDSVPFPARDLLDMRRYLRDHFESFGIKIREFGKIRSTNLISSRGCPYGCTFCFKDMWGRQWRGRSPDNIIDEMELLNRNYGVNGFFFNDDTFVLNSKRVFEFCRRLGERGLNVAWYGNGRVNLMTREMLEAMYRAGCRGIAYGIESGNQEILDAMKKAETIEQVREVVKWTKEAGIHVTGYFMLGMLGETRQTIEKTLDFARELDLDFYGFSLTTPLPGTELYDAARAAGLVSGDKTRLGEWSLHANANLTRDCTDSELVAFSNRAFKEFYLKKRFGKYFFLNPVLWKEQVKVIASLRNRAQAGELFGKIKGTIGTYRRR